MIEDAPGFPAIGGARCLALLGDSVTTDHISPAGRIEPETPAGQYLIQNGVAQKDFNSFGSRRGNDRVMTRGTFANVRIKNRIAADGDAQPEGGWTRNFTKGGDLSSAPVEYIYDAAMDYKAAGTPLVVLAGKDYGMAADDSDKTKEAYGVQWWPYYVIVDREGIVRAAGVRSDKVSEVVDRLLVLQPPKDKEDTEMAPRRRSR